MKDVQDGLADPKEIMDAIQSIKEGIITELRRYRIAESMPVFKQRIEVELKSMKIEER